MAWADDIPPGELNRQTAMGQHFGHPWYGGGDTRTNEYADVEIPVEVIMPQVNMVAHAADLGMRFYQGQAVPREVSRGNLLRSARVLGTAPHRWVRE